MTYLISFSPYCYHDGSAHGDGNKKPPEGGYVIFTELAEFLSGEDLQSVQVN